MTENSHTRLWTPQRRVALGAVLILWLGAAIAIGATGALAVSGDSPFRPIALSAAVPVAVFLAFYFAVPGFHRFVLAQDIVLLTSLHHWRVMGFAFLLLYAHDVLPGLFAWFAGAGDVMIGLMAPYVVMRLRSEPGYATSGALARFHLLGLLDFAVAVTAASLTSGAFPGLIENGLTSGAMEVWPLNLFPSFIVPLFIITHLTVLFKLQELRRGSAAQASPAAA